MSQYRLLYNPASPFARKAWIAAKLCGLEDQLELITISAMPHKEAEELTAHNPLGKIPALLLEDGSAVYDSRMIVFKFVADSGNASLYAGEDGLMTMQLEALADGLCDAAVALRYETFARPEEYRWPAFIARQQLRIRQAAIGFDGFVDYLSADSIGGVAAIAAFDYIAFRMPEFDWRSDAPKFAAWYDQAREGDVFVSTRPS